MFVFLFMVLQLVLKQDPICDAISGLVMLMCLHITPFQSLRFHLAKFYLLSHPFWNVSKASARNLILVHSRDVLGSWKGWRMSNGPRPSGGWIKIRVGGITDQTWNILFSPKLLGGGGDFRTYHFSVLVFRGKIIYRNLLINFWVIFS
jgi:hypothetical protein